MTEISLKSSDLLYLSCAIYDIANPKAVIQIIPGLKEHKSRYNEVIKELNNNGFNVFISDTRGHGRSISGDYPLGYIDDNKKLVDDENIIIDFLRTRYPGLPIYLFGDSLGSDIALAFIQKYDADSTRLYGGTSGYFRYAGVQNAPVTVTVQNAGGGERFLGHHTSVRMWKRVA